MTSEKLKEESKLTYDDRRKVLVQKKTQVTENKSDSKETTEQKHLSTVEQSMEVTYSEAGIKLAMENLVKQKKGAEKRIAELEKKDMPEMDRDLKELKEKLERLQKYQAIDKSKEELKLVKENLKSVEKDIKEIKDEIGTRLKL